MRQRRKIKLDYCAATPYYGCMTTENKSTESDKPRKAVKKKINHYDFLPIRWKGLGHEMSIRVYGDMWQSKPFEEIDQHDWVCEVVVDKSIVYADSYTTHKEASRAAEHWAAGHFQYLLADWARATLGITE